jgi:replicative DNA helicase
MFKYELVIAKQRNGPVDNVDVVFRNAYTTFESASKVSDR